MNLDVKIKSVVMNCNRDFFSDKSGVASMKQTNAANNAVSNNDLKNEIEQGKLMKSLRKVKQMRNITKEYV